MYIANHAYCVEGMDVEAGQKEIKDLIDFATQPKYVCAVSWHEPGDLGKPVLPSAPTYPVLIARSDLGQHVRDAPCDARRVRGKVQAGYAPDHSA